MALRIVHVTNEPFGLESANGVQQMVYCLARAQADMGQAVAVFSRDDHGVTLLGGGVDLGPCARSTVGPTSAHSLRQRLLSRQFERPMAEAVLAWQPDVVHFHSVHIPQNVALAAHLLRAGVPYCATVHGGLFQAALRRSRVKKAVFDLLFERHYLNHARFIHALTPREADAIRLYGVTRPIVIAPNGLPPDSHIRAVRSDALHEKYPWLRDRRVFMFIGRLDPWQKGLDLLIRAFAQARLGAAALVFVGPDCRGSRRRLARLADRLDISSELVFVEAAFGQERANLFAAADVFVHPSRWEGLSLSVLAAAVGERPCLITREADPLGQLEGANAAIVVDATVSSIAEGLRRASNLSSQELQMMGTRARRVADLYFNWPAAAATLVEAYRSAGDSNRASNST